MRIYIEDLNIVSIITLLTNLLFKKNFKQKEKKIFYIYSSRKTYLLSILFLKILKIKSEQLTFTMMEIKDEKNQNIRSKIPEIDFFQFEKKFLKSNSYNLLTKNSNIKKIEKFILKNFIAENYAFKNSVFRILYLINVVFYKNKKNKIFDSFFIIKKRPWFELYIGYALDFNIKVIPNIINFQFFENVNYKIILFLKKIRLLNSFNFKNENIITKNHNKLYCEGRGSVNLQKNGNHSDFFWLLYSKFPKKNVLYNCYGKKKWKKILDNEGINTTLNFNIPLIYTKNNIFNMKINNSFFLKEEKRFFKKKISEYEYQFNLWYNYFKFHNVKVFFTWDKYFSNHIFIGDAIKATGGISSIWQMAFDGLPLYECRLYSDINFCNSLFSLETDDRIGSRYRYGIVTGFCQEYPINFIKQKATELRKKLQKNGAKKIVCVLDENSRPDSRWHTGHDLQRENYKFIIEELLNNQNLGVIFKPKTAGTLRERLGDVNDLLIEAEKTGRCYVYESTHITKLTNASPLLAGLSSDLVIHGHLDAGTAAIECALYGIPTLLIDREGTYNSKFYVMPKGKIIFEDWPSTILALKDHFFKNNYIKDFGNWEKYIHIFDPFRDNKGSYRIGNYLKDLIEGFDRGLSREEVLFESAQKYKTKWGADKVIIR